MAVVEFVNALGTWVEESLLRRLHKVPFFRIKAEECTDVTTIEELTICCRWVESGIPEGHFIEILPLKKANAGKYLFCISGVVQEKENSVGKAYKNGIWWSCYFLCDKTGVQWRLKELSPHTLFLHCRCHVLQLASVQAANATPGIKYVYTTLMTLGKFLHYSPKHAEL